MLEVAPALLGCVVSFGGCEGVIVETEAYHFSEPACHAYVGVIRALAPLSGIEEMTLRRGGASLCNGPGKLTQALGIGLGENGTSLISGPVRVMRGSPLPFVTGPRIGITKAADLPWRFCALGSRDVSRPWPPGLRASLAA